MKTLMQQFKIFELSLAHNLPKSFNGLTLVYPIEGLILLLSGRKILVVYIVWKFENTPRYYYILGRFYMVILCFFQ